MSWESLGSSRNSWHESLEYLNYKLKQPSEARLRAMRRQCKNGCPCQEQAINCAVRTLEWYDANAPKKANP